MHFMATFPLQYLSHLNSTKYKLSNHNYMLTNLYSCNDFNRPILIHISSGSGNRLQYLKNLILSPSHPLGAQNNRGKEDMYFKSVEDAYLYFLVKLLLHYCVKESIIWCNFYLSYKKLRNRFLILSCWLNSAVIQPHSTILLFSLNSQQPQFITVDILSDTRSGHRIQEASMGSELQSILSYNRSLT